MELRKLIVGDVLYRKYSERYSRNVIIDVATVERLTPTQALLSNGVRLINDVPKITEYKKVPEYTIKSDSFSSYRFITDNIIKEKEELNRVNKIKKWWFKSKDSFTMNELEEIYNLLNVVK